MREILYKAKRIDTGEWVYGSYLYTFCEDKNCPIVGVQGEKHWIVEENGNIFWIDEDTVCQYTGRVDKNGQKIWENDIAYMRCNGLSGYGRVVYENGCFWIDDKKRNRKYPFSNHDVKYRVDGNIFDNAELLERKESENE